MTKLLHHLGLYFIMMKKVISKPENWSVFRKQLSLEMEKVGLNSVSLVIILSFFVGAVVSIQTAINMNSPLLPSYLVGLASRDSLILEFSPTMISLILAGKVGSSIASELGSMRVTEQIDALEIMGINSASFLILPKVIAAVFFFPFLIIISMGVGIIGAWVGGLSVDITTADFMYGLKYDFKDTKISSFFDFSIIFFYCLWY